MVTLFLDKAAVEQAVASLRPAFEADGVRMEVGSIEERRVTINLFIGRNTCRECLLSVPQLETLFRQALIDREIACEIGVIFIES